MKKTLKKSRVHQVLQVRVTYSNAALSGGVLACRRRALMWLLELAARLGVEHG